MLGIVISYGHSKTNLNPFFQGVFWLLDLQYSFKTVGGSQRKECSFCCWGSDDETDLKDEWLICQQGKSGRHSGQTQWMLGRLWYFEGTSVVQGGLGLARARDRQVESSWSWRVLYALHSKQFGLERVDSEEPWKQFGPQQEFSWGQKCGKWIRRKKQGAQ